MELSIEIRKVQKVCQGGEGHTDEIMVVLEDGDGVPIVPLYMRSKLALELASKIESCCQGIVGPVEPHSAKFKALQKRLHRPSA